MSGRISRNRGALHTLGSIVVTNPPVSGSETELVLYGGARPDGNNLLERVISLLVDGIVHLLRLPWWAGKGASDKHGRLRIGLLESKNDLSLSHDARFGAG